MSYVNRPRPVTPSNGPYLDPIDIPCGIYDASTDVDNLQDWILDTVRSAIASGSSKVDLVWVREFVTELVDRVEADLSKAIDEVVAEFPLRDEARRAIETSAASQAEFAFTGRVTM